MLGDRVEPQAMAGVAREFRQRRRDVDQVINIERRIERENLLSAERLNPIADAQPTVFVVVVHCNTPM